MINKECFAYRENRGHKSCSALDKLYCESEICNFYKNKDEINIDEIKMSIKKYSK